MPTDPTPTSTPSIPEPPSPLVLAPSLYVWPANVPLYRVWHQQRAVHEFNPGVGAPTRFAPIQTPQGVSIPTLYAGSTLESAYYERIFHDVPLAREGFRTVHMNTVSGLVAGSLLARRDLQLAKLFRPDLERWGLKRSELVHTEANHYQDTAKWAAALHRDFTYLDGLIWTSNRCDPDLAVVLFGDRCAECLRPAVPAEEILTSAAQLKLLNDCAARALIHLVQS